MPAKATSDPVSGTFTLVKDQWQGTYPIADLQIWLSFYRLQQERFPTYAASYSDVVQALETLADQLQNAQ